jgi:hypothetical protein
MTVLHGAGASGIGECDRDRPGDTVPGGPAVAAPAAKLVS